MFPLYTEDRAHVCVSVVAAVAVAATAAAATFRSLGKLVFVARNVMCGVPRGRSIANARGLPEPSLFALFVVCVVAVVVVAVQSQHSLRQASPLPPSHPPPHPSAFF